MTNANRQFSFERSAHRAAMAPVAAGLLVLLGMVFQLGELGYGPLRPANFWVFSVIASSVWNMLAARVNAPPLWAVLQWWPVLLVSFGLAIVLITRRGRRVGVASVPRTGESHGE